MEEKTRRTRRKRQEGQGQGGQGGKMVGIPSWSAGLPLGPVLSNEPQYQHQVVGNDYCFALEIKSWFKHNIFFHSSSIQLMLRDFGLQCTMYMGFILLALKEWCLPFVGQ